MKRVICVLLSVTMILSGLTCLETYRSDAYAAVDTEYEIIEEGVKTSVTIDSNNPKAMFKFIPSVSGIYKYYTTGATTYGSVYNSDFKLVMSYPREYDVWYSESFCMELWLTAGETYYLESDLWNRNSGTYFVIVEKAPVASSVQIRQKDSFNLSLNEYFTFSVDFSPKGSTDLIDSWESGNNDIVTIDWSGKAFGKSIGTTTLTVTTISGLTDSITVNVVDYPEIKLNEIVSESSLGGEFYYKFIPEYDGVYILETWQDSNQFNTIVAVKDSSFKNISNDTSFKAGYRCELKAGEVYYLYGYPVTECIFTSVYMKIYMEGGEPTATPTIAPTATPEPTESPTATPTIEPTVTPEPTAIPEIITVGEKKEVGASEEKGMKRYMFIPEETGIYKFYSNYGGYDVYGQILNSLEKICYRSDNLYPYYGYYRYIGNFLIEHKLIAGEVYYLESCLTDSTYYVAIEKMPVATAIDIARKDETELKYKMEDRLSLNYTPKDGRDKIVSWVSDNPDVVTVNNDGKMFGKAFGTACITVTTESGLTDSIRVTVVDHEIVLEDEIKRSGSLWDPVYYKFVPETDGVYKTKTWRETNGSSYPISVEIYNNEFEKLHYILSNEEENIDLKAGETYYICVDSLTDDQGDTTNFMIFKENEVVTIEPTVTPQLESLLGDVNGDKKVNAEDALLVLKHTAKLEILTEEVLVVADVDVNKLIDARDALEILKHAAGLIEEF